MGGQTEPEMARQQLFNSLSRAAKEVEKGNLQECKGEVVLAKLILDTLIRNMEIEKELFES